MARGNSADPFPTGPGSRGETWLALGVVLAGLLPTIWLTRGLYTRSSILPPDAVSHAMVANAIGQGRIEGGWVDVYNGGFPLGPHYQMPALLAGALLVRLGVHAVTAIQIIGLGSSAATPLVLAAVARSLGARWYAAATGGLILAWLNPFYAFIGGMSPYLGQGLVSQAFATPVVIAAGGAVLSGRPRRLGPALAALSIAAHPQITVGAVVIGFFALPFLSRDARIRFAFALTAAFVFGVALYGPGLASFEVPFAWARVQSWKILGRSPEWFFDFLTRGELLDDRGLPVVTGFALASALVLLWAIKERPSRAALAALAAAALGSAYGGLLARLGRVGASLVEVVSPVRIWVLLPVAMATCSVVAIDVLGRRARTPFLRRAAVLLPLFVVLAALPAHVGMLRERVGLLSGCHDTAPAGWNIETVGPAVAGLRGGRLAREWKAFPDACAALLGADLEARVPLGNNLGGPGSQVGVMNLAFEQIRYGTPGSRARAEALGVRSLLTFSDAPIDPGFSPLLRRGSGLLLLREGDTDLVGIGCVERAWRGPDRALRDALYDDLAGAATTIADPSVLVTLEPAAGPVERAHVDPAGCDASRARVTETHSSPAELLALVDSPAPVDVVFRVSDFPTWQASIDGAPAPRRRVAPGFFSVRVSEGHHAVRARAGPLRFYVAGLVLAVALVAALSFPDVLRRWLARD